MHYHAHVYWNDDAQRATAMRIRTMLEELGCPLGRVMDSPIGPHPLPMYQVNYSSSNREAVEGMLASESNGLSILMHNDTGDDVHDHTVGARWLGDPVTLDIEWLEDYQRRKSA